MADSAGATSSAIGCFAGLLVFLVSAAALFAKED